MSIDQARRVFLALALAQIATERRKLSLEMATIQKIRRQLAVKGTDSARWTTARAFLGRAGERRVQSDRQFRLKKAMAGFKREVLCYENTISNNRNIAVLRAKCPRSKR